MKNMHGGGAKTNKVGLHFEQETSLETALTNAGYRVTGNGDVFLGEVKVAESVGKRVLYKKILEPKGIDYKKIISKQLLPDEALYIPARKVINIIEKKFQSGAGSVDEKLQTCEFKKTQYEKLFRPLGIAVEYRYVLSDWFRKDEYRDVLQFIKDKGCFYTFNEIPIKDLKLEDDTRK